MTARQRQYQAVSYARRYDDIGRRATALIWLKRALAFAPFTPQQIYHLRLRYDESFLASVGIPPSERKMAVRS